MIRFATSAFHAYAHEWSCQLKYNPRLNKGFGLSDGEGSERVWSELSSIIAPNRCSTAQHRLDAIDLKASHGNEIRVNNAGMFLSKAKFVVVLTTICSLLNRSEAQDC